MNQKSIFESQQTQIDTLRSKVEKTKDSIQSLHAEIQELKYFRLQGNENAMTYLEDMGYNVKELETQVTEWIYDQNVVSEDHPLVPFSGLQGGMKINKIQFLNHKWILADFTDGQYWGEIILELNVLPNRDFDVKLLGSLIYPQ